MSRQGRYEQAERELAYRVWCQCEGNMDGTLRRLNAEHEWPLSKQTLYDWRETYGWISRRAADDAESARRERAAQSDTLAVLASLEVHREQYERYFSSIAAAGEIDPKATQAYANLLRVVLSIKETLAAEVARDQAKTGQSEARPGGLTDEALAEIEAKIGLR